MNKPQDFSFRLVYEEFVISNKFYKHLCFVRPNLIYTLYKNNMKCGIKERDHYRGGKTQSILS